MRKGKRPVASDTITISASSETLPAVATAYPVATTMSFMDGTDGRPRLSYARAYQGPAGYGWNAMSGSLYSVQGGDRTAREAPLASAVAIDLVTKNPTLMTIVETAVTHIMGPAGLTLSSKPVAALLGLSPEATRSLATSIEAAWNAWANNPVECDLSGRNDIHALAAAFLRHCLLSGEGLATIDWQRCRGAMTRTKVSLLDPRQLDRSQTKTVNGGNATQGVVFDSLGRRIGYMLKEVPLGSITYSGTARFVSATTAWGRTKVLHVFEQVDARQVRGLSPLVAALTPANEKENLTEFTLANALIQTSYAATVQSDLPPAQALGGLNSDGPTPHNPIGDFLEAREKYYDQVKISLRPGVVQHLSPGDRLVMNKAPNDGASFEPFTKSLSQSAARAAGVQVEDVTGDYSKTSFSASRLAQELPNRTTLRRRRIYIEKFYSEIFKAFLDEAVERGVIQLPPGAPEYFANRDAYSKAMWRGIGRAEPDRKKAVEADLLEIENGLATIESKLAERGLDMDSHLENVRSERERMREVGLDKPFFPGQTTTQIKDETINESNDLKDSEDPNDV